MAHHCKGHSSCYHSDHNKTVFYQCKSIICHSTSHVAGASIKDYGAVTYLHVNKHTAFVIAKTRVAPVKELTLLKLELMAALIAASISNFITTSLSLQGISTYLWADSQIVFYRIQSNKKPPTFVAHRINEIHQLTSTAAWRYCPTESNPADLLTRNIQLTAP